MVNFISDFYNTSNIANYRSFQYRLLQRGLVTNIQLKKWNISETDKCYFCHQTIETITHLLYECKKVQEIWTKVFQWIQLKFPSQPLEISKKKHSVKPDC